MSIGIDSLFGKQNKEAQLKANETLLISECIKGKSIAQKVLYEENYKRMLGLCYRYAGNDLEAEDMLHEGFMKVFNNLHKFKQDSKLSTWINRVVTNHCIDTIRKNKRSKIVYTDEVYETKETVEIEEEEIAEFSCEMLIEMMHELPVGYRTVLMLYSIDGYSHDEIAEKLKISTVTSRSQLSRARKMFKEIVNERRGLNA